ncbi:hypothetical protein [Plasticicumulans acidivorans]|uniref:F5/8 type C domain-containing protein n=1 Tax=Plasticicumulans acidivorans TaxID=886464 RepID=A0A317N0K8_9GAMM|nr:hypothetical protein [Plasticicumulans acidivorans]PWV66006.1 hypothetical protein C7443_101494 [Plasticicumulans acidivorans]
MFRDQSQNLSVAASLVPAARTATANGTGIDLQGFRAATVIVSAGTITDGTHTPKVQESDDNSAWTDVDAADLTGLLVAIISASVQEVGYRGLKRYLRVVSTVSGATTGGVYSASVIRGQPLKSPK